MTAATTVGQRTKTSLDGRSEQEHGYPIPVARSPASFPGVAYVVRGVVDKPNAIARTRRYLREAFAVRSSRARGSRWSRSSPCAPPAGPSPPTRARSTSATRWRAPSVSASCARDPAPPDGRPHPRSAGPYRARPAPPHRRDARRRRPHVRGARRRRQPRRGHRLRAEGVGPLDRVLWWGPTGVLLDVLELGYGVSKAGAVLAPINPNFTEPEAVDAFETLTPRAVVTHPDTEEPARVVAARFGVPVITTGPGWHADASPTAPPVGSSEDPCVVFLTSGSTGVSKGAVLSHCCPPGCAPSSARRRRRDRASRRRGDVRPVPHGRVVLPRERARRTAPCTSSTDRNRTSSSVPSSAGAPVASIASPVYGSASSTTTARTTRRRWSRC